MPAPSPWLEASWAALTASFEEGGTGKYSRADGLRSLIRPVIITGGAFPVLAWARAPDWTLIADGVAFFGFLGLYALAYAYAFFTRPDFLRSEEFELTKYAIEKRLLGTNSTGLVEAAPNVVSAEPVEIGEGAK